MHSILAFDTITPRELSRVLDTARALLRSAAASEPGALLRGRQFGLLCESDQDADAASAQHLTATLVDQLTGEASAADKRRVIVQAVLLGSVA